MDVYPGFGGFTGMTDTDLFTYANTNDRGRDPRAVYYANQDRYTMIAVAKMAFKPDWWRGSRIDLKAKFIYDRDLRDESTPLDDYLGKILRAKASISARPLDELVSNVGIAYDYWIEDGRSGSYAGGMARFENYTTQKIKPFIEFKYSIGALSAQYHLEAMKKTVDITPDTMLSSTSGMILRSIGSISAQF
jgi:hypothetical protein